MHVDTVYEKAERVWVWVSKTARSVLAIAPSMVVGRAGRERMCAGMDNTARATQGTPEGLLSVQRLAPIE